MFDVAITQTRQTLATSGSTRRPIFLRWNFRTRRDFSSARTCGQSGLATSFAFTSAASTSGGYALFIEQTPLNLFFSLFPQSICERSGSGDELTALRLAPFRSVFRSYAVFLSRRSI